MNPLYPNTFNPSGFGLPAPDSVHGRLHAFVRTNPVATIAGLGVLALGGYMLLRKEPEILTNLRENPIHCDLSQLPVDLDSFTRKQREDLLQLLSEQPLWWLRAKRKSLPSLGTERVQRLADQVFAEAITRRIRFLEEEDRRSGERQNPSRKLSSASTERFLKHGKVTS